MPRMLETRCLCLPNSPKLHQILKQPLQRVLNKSLPTQATIISAISTTDDSCGVVRSYCARLYVSRTGIRLVELTVQLQID